MDQVTVNFLGAMSSRVAARQAQVDAEVANVLGKIDLVLGELISLQTLFNDAHLQETDEGLRGQVYEYKGSLDGLERRFMEAKEALTKVRISSRQLDEVDGRIGDPLRNP
jgi:hypothetical protein